MRKSLPIPRLKVSLNSRRKEVQLVLLTIFLVSSILLLGGCSDHNGQEKTQSNTAKVKVYHLVSIRCDNEIKFKTDFNDNTTVEILDSWVILHFDNGDNVLINKEKVWSLVFK